MQQILQVWWSEPLWAFHNRKMKTCRKQPQIGAQSTMSCTVVRPHCDVKQNFWFRTTKSWHREWFSSTRHFVSELEQISKIAAKCPWAASSSVHTRTLSTCTLVLLTKKCLENGVSFSVFLEFLVNASWVFTVAYIFELYPRLVTSCQIFSAWIFLNSAESQIKNKARKCPCNCTPRCNHYSRILNA